MSILKSYPHSEQRFDHRKNCKSASRHTLRKSLMVVPALYMLYVLKWAVGIDIFDDYHAPKFVKLPAEVAVHSIQQLGFDVALPGQPMAEKSQEFKPS